MTIEDLKIIIYILAAGILVLLVASLFSSSRFAKPTHRDKFKDSKQIGKQNIGKTRKNKSYKDIAKERGLEEAKTFERSVNTKVTKSLSSVSKEMQEKD